MIHPPHTRGESDPNPQLAYEIIIATYSEACRPRSIVNHPEEMRWPYREKGRSNYCQLDYELSIAIYLVGAGHLFTVHHRNALAIQRKTAF